MRWQTMAELMEGVPGIGPEEAAGMEVETEEGAEMGGAESEESVVPQGRTADLEGEREESGGAASGSTEKEGEKGRGEQEGHTHTLTAPSIITPDFKPAGGELEVNPWTRQEDVDASSALTQHVKVVKEMLQRKGWFNKWTPWRSVNEEVFRSVRLPDGGLTMSSQQLYKVVQWAVEEGCVKKKDAGRTTVMFTDALQPAGRSRTGSTTASPAPKKIASNMPPPAPPGGRGQQGATRGRGAGRFQPPRQV